MLVHGEVAAFNRPAVVPSCFKKNILASLDPARDSICVIVIPLNFPVAAAVRGPILSMLVMTVPAVPDQDADDWLAIVAVTWLLESFGCPFGYKTILWTVTLLIQYLST